jgi:aconitate hydratase
LQEYRRWAASHPNSFRARKSLKVGGKNYAYFSSPRSRRRVGDLSRLPFSLRILMENLVRHEDGADGQESRHRRLRPTGVKNGGKSTKEIKFPPGTRLMQDFTGVPAVVDLAAMRDAMGKARTATPRR